MRKLDVFGKLMVGIGGLLIIIHVILYVQGLQIIEDEKKGVYCTTPGQSCPLPSMSAFILNIQLGIIITSVGIGLIIVSKKYLK